MGTYICYRTKGVAALKGQIDLLVQKNWMESTTVSVVMLNQKYAFYCKRRLTNKIPTLKAD